MFEIPDASPEPKQLVLNWHIAEACNYSCKYCYASWDVTEGGRDLIRDHKRTTSLLTALFEFFRPENLAHPLRSRMTWSGVRLNFAGGEPLLFSRELEAAVLTSNTIGFDVSLITNGSRLTPQLMSRLAPRLSLLGLSIDSMSMETNASIGRVDRQGRQVDLEELSEMVRLGRRLNPAMRVKLNTVVNRLNQADDLTPLIRQFAPDRWKVLRMLPVRGRQLEVSDDQFDSFVARHRQLGEILCAEDNLDMTESYLMIDPQGRFFQNEPATNGRGYMYSQPILEVGVAKAFNQIAFNPQRFAARYAGLPPVEVQ
ncbi:radical SAM protein [beta proteobacterium AAP121]|nr:radical SAM protein [beta proteobacterium AAP65]KPF96411.1 radical SAM protein [beta proteobacterium AAP121]